MLSFNNYFFCGGVGAASDTRSTREPLGNTTVSEILVTEGFSFNCGALSLESVLLGDKEGQDWIKDCL